MTTDAMVLSANASAAIRELEGIQNRLDGWENVVLGIGGRRDPTSYTRMCPRPLIPAEQFEWAVIEDHFAAKCVEMLPAEGLRPGWDVIAIDNPQETARIRDSYRMREDELAVPAKMREGSYLGRGLGGAVTWIGADDGRDPREPLDESAIATIRFLQSFDRKDIYIWKYYSDPLSPKNGEPEIYWITPSPISSIGGGLVQLPGSDRARAGGVFVHESRVVRWPGQPTTRRRQQLLGGWDDSVLERCWDALKQVGEDFGTKGMLLSRAAAVIYQLEGALKMMAGKERELLEARMYQLDVSRRLGKSVIIDKNENVVGHPQPLSGTPELMLAGIQRLANAAGIPLSIFWQGPSGMNADGESDRDIWHEKADDWRTHELKPRHERIAQLIFLAKDGPTNGVEPKTWSVVYRPLRVPTEQERSEIEKNHAEADAKNIEKGIYVAEDVTLARYTMLGTGSVRVDQATLEAKIERRRIQDKEPPKDNAELGTVGARLTAIAELLKLLNTGVLTRTQVKRMLVNQVRLTDEQAEEQMDTPAAIAALEPPPAPPTPPGPRPGPPNGTGAGAPPQIPGLNDGGDPR